MPKILASLRALVFGSAGSEAVSIGVDGDTNPRLRIDAGGRITWGDGAASGDAYLERSGAGVNTFSGELVADSYKVDVAATPTVEVGKLSWNDGDGTMDLGLKGGNAILQLGQETLARVFNEELDQLSDGEVVAITGAQGNRVSVVRCDASSGSSAAHAFGVVTEPINSGEEGFVTVRGSVRGLNTDIVGYTEGDQLYADPNTPGGWINTRPTAPDHAVQIGYLQRKHASVGTIYVEMHIGEHLEYLHDVSINSPTDGQAIVWDALNGYWKNASVSGGGAAGDTISPLLLMGA